MVAGARNVCRGRPLLLVLACTYGPGPGVPGRMSKEDWWMLWEMLVFLAALGGVVLALVAVNVVLHG